MILLEIDPVRITVPEFEGKAPRSVDMYAVARRLEAAQSVKVESGQAHLLGGRGDVQTRKTNENARMHSGVDARSSGGPQPRKLLVAEALDHGPL